MAVRYQIQNPEMTGIELRQDLERRKASLYLRLEDGYNRIEQAISDGTVVDRWDDLWIRLLTEYEQISDQLAVEEH